MNRFIEALFNDKADYYLVKMEDISNAIHTYDGSVFLISFTLPREYWDRKLENITIGEYEKLKRMTLEANISLSNPDYPPFQLGQTISEVSKVTPIRYIDVWEFIERARKSEKKDYFSIQSILHDMVATPPIKGKD